jgi:hypothetical protein
VIIIHLLVLVSIIAKAMLLSSHLSWEALVARSQLQRREEKSKV